MLKDIVNDLEFIGKRINIPLDFGLPPLITFPFKAKTEFLKSCQDYLSELSELKSNASELIDDLTVIGKFLEDFTPSSQIDPLKSEFMEDIDALKAYGHLGNLLIDLFVSFNDNYNDAKHFLQDFLESGLSYSLSDLKYLYSAINRILFLHINPETLLFDFIKGFSEHVLFYYPLFSPDSSSLKLESRTFLETDKDDFFSWLLVMSNKYFRSSELKSTVLKDQKRMLENFLEENDESNLMLRNYKTSLLHNLGLYEKYGNLSVMRFGFELYAEKANSLLEAIIQNDSKLKRIKSHKLGARAIINYINSEIRYLVVDYSNRCKEKMLIDDFYIAYVLPVSKFDEYLKKGDLFINFFLWKGKPLRFNDPFQNGKIVYSSREIGEILEFNRKNFSRFGQFLEANNVTFESIEYEEIQPYFSLLKDLKIISNLYQDPNGLMQAFAVRGQLKY